MSRTRQVNRLLLIIAAIGISTWVLQAKADGKLTPAELIAKHLESIGPVDVRSKIHGMKAKGSCVLTVRQGGTGQVSGQALMASQENQNLINMTFDSPEYPFELLSFDGKKFTASQFKPGVRTPI